ncbi:hypothetical protein SCHPADRAFT_933754 [Schizopora paradoxa]|uniref:Uncharacterized protein n=1 Tax=Schizopora paradoxa TaxID=27342 RepID=A0A0H2R6N7_9AGAM|nr:hypothetical protein SCHPADRAFT_933754 [Schizopora paradoxa]
MSRRKETGEPEVRDDHDFLVNDRQHPKTIASHQVELATRIFKSSFSLAFARPLPINEVISSHFRFASGILRNDLSAAAQVSRKAFGFKLIAAGWCRTKDLNILGSRRGLVSRPIEVHEKPIAHPVVPSISDLRRITETDWEIRRVSSFLDLLQAHLNSSSHLRSFTTFTPPINAKGLQESDRSALKLPSFKAEELVSSMGINYRPSFEGWTGFNVRIVKERILRTKELRHPPKGRHEPRIDQIRHVFTN